MNSYMGKVSYKREQFQLLVCHMTAKSWKQRCPEPNCLCPDPKCLCPDPNCLCQEPNCLCPEPNCLVIEVFTS